MKNFQIRDRQMGVGLIEVLVTLVILLVGLLGTAGLMLQSQRAEMESYQRIQALILLQDMVERINTNRAIASCYAITTDIADGAPFLGKDSSILPPTCAAGTTEQNVRAITDLQDWHALLTGASELTGNNDTAVGTMIDARGCISFNAITGMYTVSIAWQGLGNTSAPVAALTCGKDLYTAETQRRVVSATLHIANLGA